MQGTGALTAYAGQTIYFSGAGTFYAHNYEASMEGAGTLIATAGVPGVSTLNGSGYLSVYAQQATTSATTIPALVSKGGDFAYDEGAVNIPALTTYGEGGFYVSEAVYGGYTIIPALVSVGLMKSIGHMQGDVSAPALITKGGDYVYGEGSATIPAMISLGAQGYGNLIVAIDRASVASTLDLLKIMALSITEIATVSDSFTPIRVMLLSVVDSATATDSITIHGVYFLNVTDEAVASSVNTSQVITTSGGAQAAVDSSMAVWCINLDTGASSQYEQFGFNSFFERDGYYYGVADDGIYELDGTDDTGTDIAGLIDFGTSDLGVPGKKKVCNVYVGTSDGTDMYLKVETTSGTNTYQLEACTRGSTDWRVKIPHSVQGANWRWTLITAKDFELDRIEFKPTKLSRRL